MRENLSISYAEVMADYITESVLYESYSRSLKSSPTTLLGHAARLRAFLYRHKRQTQLQRIEKQSFEIFIKKWSFQAATHIQEMLYISLLEQLGDEVREIDVGDVACRSSVAKVSALLQHDQAQDAFEVAQCAFRFIKEQRSYFKSDNVHYGFKLSGLMVLLGTDKPVKASIDAKIQQNMRQLSQEIIREVLKCCKESNLEFVRLPLPDLNGLIVLLGKQQNYADLEVCYIPLLFPITIKAHHHLSGSSSSCGSVEKYKSTGNQTPSSKSAAASSRLVTSTPPKSAAPKPSACAKTFATTSAVYGVRLIPRQSRCPIYYPSFTSTWATRAKPKVCTRTSSASSQKAMMETIEHTIQWISLPPATKWNCSNSPISVCAGGINLPTSTPTSSAI